MSISQRQSQRIQEALIKSNTTAEEIGMDKGLLKVLDLLKRRILELETLYYPEWKYEEAKVKLEELREMVKRINTFRGTGKDDQSEFENAGSCFTSQQI
ncbi:hypothetical protein HUN88_05840 [Bacillus amyloliquefaciens]|uniref:hypothetical protein n=1 Tax=Bacillus amyloliquefaciens group TaxID=1938374 RepID=UPI00146F4BA9|nr:MULTISPECIES: hypothetical protein [Bacillus amyloliquefaciens group]NMV98065.1 hypothetical protein [Bacillus velezensis]NUI59277.1 hypothetical protein [Bacillus amyloliquefaciens]